jgi:hypothetical protein
MLVDVLGIVESRHRLTEVRVKLLRGRRLAQFSAPLLRAEPEAGRRDTSFGSGGKSLNSGLQSLDGDRDRININAELYGCRTLKAQRGTVSTNAKHRRPIYRPDSQTSPSYWLPFLSQHHLEFTSVSCLSLN